MVNVSSLFGKKYDGVVIDSAFSLATIMLDRASVTVIPCESFGAPEYVRLSYATSDEDIVKGIDRFKEFVKKVN